MSALVREPHLQPRTVRIDGRDEVFLVPTFGPAVTLITADTTEKVWRKPPGTVLVEIRAIGGGGGGGSGASGAGCTYGPRGYGGAGGGAGGVSGVGALRPDVPA